MKRLKYSNGYKSMLILLEHIFVLMITITIVVMGTMGLDGNFFDMVRRQPFIESTKYTNMVKEDASHILRYAENSQNFETDGIYDEDKIVDIKDYATKNQITGKLPNGLGYKLDELCDWEREGIKYEEVTVCQRVDGTFQYLKGNVNVEELVLDTNEEYVDNWIITSIKQKEKPLVSEDGTRKDILEIANSDSSLNGQLANYYEYLEESIKNIQGKIISYKEMKKDLETKNVNIKYMALNEQKEIIYTNQTSKKISADDFKKFQNECKEKGHYLIFNSRTLDFNTNIKFEEKLDVYSRLRNSGENDYLLAMNIDTDFPYHDDYYEASNQYQKIQPWFIGIMFAGLISIIGWLICIFEITMKAGREKKNSEVILRPIDKIKTEIAAALVMIVITIELSPFVSIGVGGKYDIWSYVIICIATLLTNTVLLISYLSLVRRIKARTLWKNSLVYGIFKMIDHAFSNRILTSKTIILYCLFVFANIILFSSGAGFLAIILDVLVGLQIMKDLTARKEIMKGVRKISEGNLNYKINTFQLNGANRDLAEHINNIGEGIHLAVEANLKNERLKTDLITNVSHDIKTPLTSIINYVGLLKRADIKDEQVRSYIDVLEQKSLRLKDLTDDLVEASKLSSGNVKINFDRLNFKELIYQSAGEFSEKFEKNNLELVMDIPQKPIIILADGRRIYRVLENLYNNVAKYAMPHTRVYVRLEVIDNFVVFSIKNISEKKLNIKSEELTERFIRGDVSRSTEGSGLGLSIAKNLVELQKGEFIIYLDGDLFKVVIKFPVQPEEKPAAEVSKAEKEKVEEETEKKEAIDEKSEESDEKDIKKHCK